ncbi:hypothetical protein GH131_10610 [Staphylococcus pseudintermedius]|nr:hypothetical protein [Staphylococcus pseudintermedius]
MTRDFNKIILFDALRTDVHSDVCNCGNKAKYTLDCKNMTVHCDVCGNRVEPFKALENLANKYSEFNQQIQLMQDEYMKLKLYKPHLLTIKTLEKHQRESNRGNKELGTKKYPCCPNCKEPFELSEIEHTWEAGIFIQKRLDDRLYQLNNDD